MGSKYKTLRFCESSWNSWRSAPRELRFQMAKALGALWSAASRGDHKPGWQNSFGTGILSRLLDSVQFVQHGVRVVYGTLNREIRIDSLGVAGPDGGDGGGFSEGYSNIREFNFEVRISEANGDEGDVTESIAADIIECNLDRFAEWFAFVLSENGDSSLFLEHCGYEITISSAVVLDNESGKLSSHTDGPATSSIRFPCRTFSIRQSVTKKIARNRVLLFSDVGGFGLRLRLLFLVIQIHHGRSVGLPDTWLPPAVTSDEDRGSARLSAFGRLRQLAASHDLAADFVTGSRSILRPVAWRVGRSVGLPDTWLSPASISEDDRGGARLSVFDRLRQLIVQPCRAEVSGTCSAVLHRPCICSVGKWAPDAETSNVLGETEAVPVT